jgi:hypothetical protein
VAFDIGSRLSITNSRLVQDQVSQIQDFGVQGQDPQDSHNRNGANQDNPDETRAGCCKSVGTRKTASDRAGKRNHGASKRITGGSQGERGR